MLRRQGACCSRLLPLLLPVLLPVLDAGVTGVWGVLLLPLLLAASG
jgi:hypothetical protein